MCVKGTQHPRDPFRYSLGPNGAASALRAWVFRTCPAKCFCDFEHYGFLFGAEEYGETDKSGSGDLPFSRQFWLPDRCCGKPLSGRKCSERRYS